MTHNQKFIVKPGDDRIRFNLIEAIKQWPRDVPLEANLSKPKDSRSDQQNRALFGVLYPPLMEFMGLRGQSEKEYLHEFFCGDYFGWREIDIMGAKKKAPVRTTTTNADGKREVLSKPEFAGFMDFIYQRAAEAGCVLPDPIPVYEAMR